MRYGLGLVFPVSLRGSCYLGAEHMCTECIDACWSLAIESRKFSSFLPRSNDRPCTPFVVVVIELPRYAHSHRSVVVVMINQSKSSLVLIWWLSRSLTLH